MAQMRNTFTRRIFKGKFSAESKSFRGVRRIPILK